MHANISHYNEFVQSQITDGKSWFQTSANLGNYHEINYRKYYTSSQPVACDQQSACCLIDLFSLNFVVRKCMPDRLIFSDCLRDYR